MTRWEDAKALELPTPIRTDLAAARVKDPEVLVRGFADDALVCDEDRDYRGLAAIVAWKRDAAPKRQYVRESLEFSAGGDRRAAPAWPATSG